MSTYYYSHGYGYDSMDLDIYHFKFIIPYYWTDLDMAPCLHIIAHMDMDMAPCPYYYLSHMGYSSIWILSLTCLCLFMSGSCLSNLLSLYWYDADLDMAPCLHIITHMDLDMSPCLHIIAHMDMDMTPCLHICHFKLLSLTSWHRSGYSSISAYYCLHMDLDMSHILSAVMDMVQCLFVSHSYTQIWIWLHVCILLLTWIWIPDSMSGNLSTLTYYPCYIAWHRSGYVSMSAYYCSHGYGYGSMSTYYCSHGYGSMCILCSMDVDMEQCVHIITHMDMDMTPCLDIFVHWITRIWIGSMSAFIIGTHGSGYGSMSAYYHSHGYGYVSMSA